MDKSQNNYTEEKKSGTKQYILYDSIYIKFKEKFTSSMEREIRTVVVYREEREGLIGKRHKRTFGC